MRFKKYPICVFFSFFLFSLYSQEGYKLWLDYKKIADVDYKEIYAPYFGNVQVIGDSPTTEVIKEELQRAKKGWDIENFSTNSKKLIIGKIKDLPFELEVETEADSLGEEGYHITHTDGKEALIVTGNTDIALLYGTFGLLRELQQGHPILDSELVEKPKIERRVLNHWDNLDRTVERGYAGFSIWDWHLLPELIKPEYKDYARANASIGINGVVLNNVNASPLVLNRTYIEKVKALADVFRPYGIRVYLSAKFSSPMELGKLKTADPLDKGVEAWWKAKIDTLYTAIPDFGGFLIKANSEGQPGPQDYHRTHADGANMLARAIAPHDGIIMWRAFVYSENDPEDRAKQAYNEFLPLDGKFEDNVLVQVKNGAIDFQPREPFHPLFGAMPNTSLMMEFQITQEYLGFSSHLVFLPKLFEETLEEDTHTNGKNSSVAKVVDGSLSHKKLTGIAGVANVGTARNWTEHPFGQANWFGFGRLAWDPYLKAEDTAREWLKLKFSTEGDFVKRMTDLLLTSREAVVNYMTPLGLHHLMGTGHHYGPAPWVDTLARPEWNPVYYHKADTGGIGFDRTGSGSDALSQYAPPLQKKYGNPETTPDKYLLWFHHLPWDYPMKNGKTLWKELALHYQKGVDQVKSMQYTWRQMESYVNNEEFEETEMLLKIQLKEARWWRDACLIYFQQFSKMELPDGVPEPKHPLDYYKSLQFPYAPGHP